MRPAHGTDGPSPSFASTLLKTITQPASDGHVERRRFKRAALFPTIYNYRQRLEQSQVHEIERRRYQGDVPGNYYETNYYGDDSSYYSNSPKPSRFQSYSYDSYPDEYQQNYRQSSDFSAYQQQEQPHLRSSPFCGHSASQYKRNQYDSYSGYNRNKYWNRK